MVITSFIIMICFFLFELKDLLKYVGILNNLKVIANVGELALMKKVLPLLRHH